MQEIILTFWITVAVFGYTVIDGLSSNNLQLNQITPESKESKL